MRCAWGTVRMLHEVGDEAEVGRYGWFGGGCFGVCGRVYEGEAEEFVCVGEVVCGEEEGRF